ncbi:MAG: hypothetical protein U9R24_03200 [Thermodesulfobacteriota bacterium]|nr:hypothetical protein [Thermodesulfobacteriota bacterium]
MKRYTHEELHSEVRTISGGYSYLKEELLSYKERDVLCVVGEGHVDNSCCGVGGCIFIDIPGYVVSLKNGKDESGLDVSEVEPILDPEDKSEIARILDNRYPLAQIRF